MQDSNAGALVVVVDDDAFSQAFFTEMLTDLGISEIHCASNGRTALKTLTALPRCPDFLVCDIFMPDMDGIEFLGHLANSNYQGKILLVSGQDASMMAIAQQMALDSGLKLVGAHTKPVALEILAQALAQPSAL